MQRLRLKFARKDKLKFLSHLDMMRLWERALRRSGVSLAYSEGFSPHPRISIAAPLAVGLSSQAELIDVFLEKRISDAVFLQKIRDQLPDGIEILEVTQPAIDAPSLQSRVRYAEYILEVETDKNSAEVTQDIQRLLAVESLPWHHKRDTSERFYDLRELIDDIWLIGTADKKCTIGMRLRCDPSRSGRPEQAARALGFSEIPLSIERTKLILA